MDNVYLGFIDEFSQLEGGITYVATGLVTTDYSQGGVGSPSMKDYSVVYINPLGSCCSEWRGVGEVRLFEMEEDDWVHLQGVFQNVADTPYTL